MGKHCQLVMGPAGAGKSTYCRVMQDHCQQLGRTCHVMNMDPACEQFSYNASVDVRDLITLKEVLDEQLLGPNGGLIYAFEHLLANSSWLDDEFGDYADDYVIIDLPGQIELFTHIPVLPRIVELLKNQGYFVASVYLMDSSVVLSDVNKYISSTLTCLSAMLTLEIPSVNFLSKMDLTKRISPDSSLSAYINCDWEMLLADKEKSEMIPKRLTTLTESIGGLLNQFPWVNYQPLDVTSVDSLDAALNIVDRILQYEDEDEAREIREEDNCE